MATRLIAGNETSEPRAGNVAKGKRKTISVSDKTGAKRLIIPSERASQRY